MSKLRDKERDRDYKKEKYSDCSRSPKRGRSERDIDHRVMHDRRFKMTTSSLLDKRGTSSDDRERERIERDRDRERDRLRERERDRSGGGNIGGIGGNANTSNNMGVLGSISATIIANALNSGNSNSSMISSSVNTPAGNTSSSVGGNISGNSINQSNDRDRVNRVGDWSEHVSSSGKKYYYNCKTEVSQWEKPREWIEKESRVLVKEQQRDYREKDRDRDKDRCGEKERDERYTSTIVNRSSASAYGKHSSSSSSSSSKNNSRGRWQPLENQLASSRRRTIEEENPDMDISPGDSTPTSDASYSHSSTPTAGLSQIGSQHSQTNIGISGGSGSTNTTAIAVSSSLTPMSSSVIGLNTAVGNNSNAVLEGVNHNLPGLLPRMVSNSAVNQTCAYAQSTAPQGVVSSFNPTSCSSLGVSMLSPALHHATHNSGTAASTLSCTQACPPDVGILSSNAPGPSSSLTSSQQQNVSTHSVTQQQGSTIMQQITHVQQQPLHSQHFTQSSIQASSASSGTVISVTTSLAGLPKILSQITGNKSIEQNDLNPQKALQTINNALMMQSRQQNPSIVHDIGNSPSMLINLSTQHNNTSNSQSNMINNMNLGGCSSGNTALTSDGPPTPTQELDLPLVDHRKIVDGLGNVVVTSTTSSSVCSLQSVMASSQCGRSQGPNLTPSLAKYFRADLISHVTGWPSEILEKTIQKLSEEAHILGDLQCSKVSAELKCARSLVRITEITATLQEQKTTKKISRSGINRLLQHCSSGARIWHVCSGWSTTTANTIDSRLGFIIKYLHIASSRSLSKHQEKKMQFILRWKILDVN
ncbi:WW domain-containing adapter protein with coiled-coil homolog isoform X2 [Anopheles merus]|uniref:WW domain-containing adapter protein with coiled-coil homolog isoform X2 n=1 Tax=Anopheles merus TaxID=30066 RepID=UPI001BE3F9A6|nr:WW domain-containing adapter protein with coiled-coil homolog isoform X2 [Anopheles merus]